MPEPVSPELCWSVVRGRQFGPPEGASECVPDAASEVGRQGTSGRLAADFEAAVRLTATAAPSTGASQR